MTRITAVCEDAHVQGEPPLQNTLGDLMVTPDTVNRAIDHRNWKALD